MNKRIIEFICFIMLFIFPLSLYSQESNNGTVVGISKGERAPFDGVLLDKKAAATILSEDNYTREKCEIDCQKKLDIQKVESDSVISNLQLSLDYEREMHIKTVEYYDNQIKYLQDYKVEPPPDDDDLMWTLIGASSGVIITSLVYGIIVSL